MLAQLACALFWFHPLAARCAPLADRARAAPVTIECWLRHQATDYADHLLAVVRAMRDTDSGPPGAVAFRAALAIRRPVARGTRCRRSAAPHRVACMARRTGRGGRVLPLAALRRVAGPASADLTSRRSAPAPRGWRGVRNGARADGEVGLVGRLLGPWPKPPSATGGLLGGLRHPARRNQDGMLSDSGPIDSRRLTTNGQVRVWATCSGRPFCARSADRSRSRRAGVGVPLPGRGSRPEDVDRIRIQSEGLAAAFGRQPLFWLGSGGSRELRIGRVGSRTAPRHEAGGPRRSEAVAVHGDPERCAIT